MSRIKMDWGWVDDYPVFIYTRWLSLKVFKVRIVIGEKGNQNAPGYGPRAKPDLEYMQKGLMSKAEVIKEAFVRSKEPVLLRNKAAY